MNGLFLLNIFMLLIVITIIYYDLCHLIGVCTNIDFILTLLIKYLYVGINMNSLFC